MVLMNTQKWVIRPLSCLVLAGLLLCTCAVAEAQSRSSLRDRLSRIRGQKQELKNNLRDAKAQELTARNDLTVAQKEYGAASQSLKDAEWALSRTQASIRRVKAELQSTEQTLKAHQAALEQRILVTHKVGQPTYVEVLLNATDFNDFVTRASFNERIAREDTRLLEALVEYKQRRDRQRQKLRADEQVEKKLRREAAARAAEVAAKKQKAERLLTQARTDRASYERQLAEMEQASKSVEAMLAALPSGSGSAGSYSGSCSGQLAWPCSGRISSPYGMRFHPVLHRTKMHTGMDIAAPGGTPIRAAAAGKVVMAGWNGAYGNCVIIDHGSGIATLYGHMQSGSLRCSRGQVVERGQTIGRCGSTGWSTGNHLHFEVRVNGSHRNPMNYL